MPSHSEVAAIAEQWIQQDPVEESRAKVKAMLETGENDVLAQLMGQRMEFGTAGLRGLMGPGYSRMNQLVVQQTAQGLLRYLQQQSAQQLAEHGVVIGNDARHLSAEFARITAAVFVEAGVRVHLFPGFVPTPIVAAGVAVLSAAAGVMVTASHNPKEYNGIKVYWGNGCQIIPPHDEGIASAILHSLTVSGFSGVATQLGVDSCSDGRHLDRSVWRAVVKRIGAHPLVSDPTHEVEADYFRRLETLHFRSSSDNAAAAPVVYTAMHGVGAPFVRRAFEVMGLQAPVQVAAQEQPDPEFPTVAFPNPEEGKGAWRLAEETGKAVGARLLLANDPDADRLAVAERSFGSGGALDAWKRFSGNEIGILLADWLWTNTRAREPAAVPIRFAVLSSAVSSRMLAAYAAAEGLTWNETLTGFKWLGNRALELEADGHTVLFAFEEAIGFMMGPMSHPKDKDGVAAAAVMAELAAVTYARGSSLAGRLDELSAKYGHFVGRASYFIADQPSKCRAVFDRLTAGGRYPESVGGVKVVSVRDLGAGYDSAEQPGFVPTLPWRAGDMMLTLRMDGGVTLTLRASGTEPKLKYYLEVAGPDKAGSEALADRLEAVVADELVQWKEAGLARPAA
ncbi:hypothetical protein FOA52_006662 [Chlamydomonas sp. UWO 241]|nr:hypothetical protein FOA52_006662 [Chlamydomonas sp. UWO 241]